MLPLLIGVVIAMLVFALIGWRLLPSGAPARGPGADLPSRPLAIEHRRLARCAKHSTRILSQTGAEEKLQEGWIVDRSAKGLGLILVMPKTAGPAAAPERGTLLEIKPTNAPQDCPWLRIEVRHLHQEAGYWHVGGTIVSDIAAGLLSYFGHEVASQDKPRALHPWERHEWMGNVPSLAGGSQSDPQATRKAN